MNRVTTLLGLRIHNFYVLKDSKYVFKNLSPLLPHTFMHATEIFLMDYFCLDAVIAGWEAGLVLKKDEPDLCLWSLDFQKNVGDCALNFSLEVLQ